MIIFCSSGLSTKRFTMLWNVDRIKYHNLLVSNRAHGLHRVKSVRIRSFSNPYFPAFGLNTDSISQHSFQMRENTD